MTGRVAVVVGGGSGIGAATARRLGAEEGASVLIGYRASREEAEGVAASLREQGIEVELARVDVGDEASVRAFADRCRERFGRCDVLVNAAGMTRWIPFADIDEVSDEDWSTILDVNLVGPFRVVRAFRDLLAASSGVVINIASTAGHRGAGSSLPYGASKAALIQLTRSLAVALAPEIRVVSVSPGTVATRWHSDRLSEAEYARMEQAIRASTPLGRVTEPEEVAEVIAGLARSRAVTGVDIIVDGGKHVTY